MLLDGIAAGFERRDFRRKPLLTRDRRLQEFGGIFLLSLSRDHEVDDLFTIARRIAQKFLRRDADRSLETAADPRELRISCPPREYGLADERLDFRRSILPGHASLEHSLADGISQVAQVCRIEYVGCGDHLGRMRLTRIL